MAIIPKPEQTRWASQEAAIKAEINQALKIKAGTVQPNAHKYGKAVVWYSKSWRSTVTGQEGGFYIRCFLPGELY